jgi:hypothetical protein
MIPSDDLSNLFVGAANDRHVSKQLSIDNAVIDQFASTPPAHFLFTMDQAFLAFRR